jgi:subtilisin-like proprotein convertase family protein
VPAGDTVKASFTVHDCEGVAFLEHVVVHVSLSTDKRGDAVIFLVSPAGTRSNLLSKRPKDLSSDGFNNWPFMTVSDDDMVLSLAPKLILSFQVHMWGESPIGTWTLEVQNAGESAMRLVEWSLDFMGSREQLHSPPRHVQHNQEQSGGHRDQPHQAEVRDHEHSESQSRLLEVHDQELRQDLQVVQRDPHEQLHQNPSEERPNRDAPPYQREHELEREQGGQHEVQGIPLPHATAEAKGVGNTEKSPIVPMDAWAIWVFAILVVLCALIQCYRTRQRDRKASQSTDSTVEIVAREQREDSAPTTATTGTTTSCPSSSKSPSIHSTSDSRQSSYYYQKEEEEEVVRGPYKSSEVDIFV